MVDARILYVLVIKISIFLKIKINVCVISKVALIVCVWLIFKHNFDLDDDFYWIQSFINKVKLTKSSF
jgi:hypothetical protein